MGESISAAGIEAAHTPGPWEALGASAVRTRFVMGDPAWPGLLVADINHTMPEARANAALIAAAPEMLDALWGLDRVLNKPGLPMHADAVQAAIESARAAIARAEGRA